MDEVYELLIHKVHDYEGTVNELTGDGIMALFGAPIALENAPQRAIRSALAIHREINKFSEQVKTEKRIPSIKMRIGIHTGPVIVGTLGNDLRVEFKAVGDTVNLASRMEGLAESGTTYVTEDTFKLTEGFFRFEALGEKKVKGKEGLIKVYQVIAPSTRRTKFDVSAEGGLTPLIGRERELELLAHDEPAPRDGPAGSAVFLVAEDEDQVRDLVVEVLTRAGYRVLPAANGVRALEVAAGFAGTIDALVTDLRMPELDGEGLARELVRRRPGVRVLLTSGYPEAHDLYTGAGSSQAFLPKPFAPAALLVALDELLRGAGEAAPAR